MALFSNRYCAFLLNGEAINAILAWLMSMHMHEQVDELVVVSANVLYLYLIDIVSRIGIKPDHVFISSYHLRNKTGLEFGCICHKLCEYLLLLSVHCFSKCRILH